MNALRVYAPAELAEDGYPLAWHATIKHDVREAAGHRCIRCGHPYTKGEGEWSRCDERCTHDGPRRASHDGIPYEPESNAALPVLIEAQWRILTVHHLDGDKANCRWWNLAALCQRCHLQIQGKVQMARVWPWEHSEWFQPYVAGYYAWAYLGEDLHHGEVMARLDELLALERAA